MWLLAINPTSGRGKGARIGQQVSNFLADRKLEYKVITGANALQLQDNLKRDSSNCSGIIAVGGDGLMHMCIQIAAVANLPLIPIPAGTGNDFVRALGWNPDKPLDPLWRALNSESTRIDLGNVDGEFFGAIASTGFDSLVNERANKMRWPKGAAKYNVAMALELPKFQPIEYRFVIDGKNYQREAMLIAAGNGSSYGGGMLVCPSADMSDGLIDLMILNPVSKREFIQIFPSVYQGKHIEHPQVEIIQAKEIYLESDAVCYADGERIGPLPATISVVEAALSTWKS